MTLHVYSNIGKKAVSLSRNPPTAPAPVAGVNQMHAQRAPCGMPRFAHITHVRKYFIVVRDMCGHAHGFVCFLRATLGAHPASNRGFALVRVRVRASQHDERARGPSGANRRSIHAHEAMRAHERSAQLNTRGDTHPHPNHGLAGLLFHEGWESRTNRRRRHRAKGCRCDKVHRRCFK